MDYDRCIELLELLREISREDAKKDYISLLEVFPKITLRRPEWTQEEIRDGLNELKRMRKIRITGNFQIRL